MATRKSKASDRNYRSSKTGRYTIKKAADRSPNTHEKERRKAR